MTKHNNSNKLLIITNKDDPHSDYLIHKINSQGNAEFVIRLNTEDFAQNSKFSFDGFEKKIYLVDSDKLFSFDEIKSIWYRRPATVDTSYVSDIGVQKYIEEETQACLDYVLYSLKDVATWYNFPLNNKFASNKLLQLNIAFKCGLSIPDTIATNIYKNLKCFFDSHELTSTKGVKKSNFLFQNDIYPKLNRIVSEDEVVEANFNPILGPTLFQQYINKQSDVRIVFLKGHVFAFEIKSQEVELSREDFRGVSPDKLIHTVIELPKKVVDGILKFCNFYGLNFSCFDFVMDSKGEFIFIENNPNGQWLWLEFATGFDLTNNFISAFLD